MCDINSEFRLCTCNTEIIDYDKPYWTLKREDQSFMAIGEFRTYYHRKIKCEKILELLNRENRFDFDPELQENDYLYLCFEEQAFHFTYASGRWEVLTEITPIYFKEMAAGTINTG